MLCVVRCWLVKTDGNQSSQAFDALRAELTSIRARTPSILNHINSRLRQLSSEWARDAIYVEKTWNARQSAPQLGSAFSASNLPGWRPAARNESGGVVPVRSTPSLASSKGNIPPDTPAISRGPTEGIQAKTNTTISTSLRNRTDVGEQNTCETTDVRNPPAGNQTSPTGPNVAEPACIAQKTSRNTLTGVSGPNKAPDVPLHETLTPGATSRNANVDLIIREPVYASTTLPTRSTCERNEEQQMREGGNGVGQQDCEAIRARAQENENRSDDQVGEVDDGDGGDDNEGSADEYDDEEERGATDKLRPLVNVNDGRQKPDGHTTVENTLFPVAASNPNRGVLGEASGQGQCAENSTESAQDSAHHQTAVPVHQSACSSRAVVDGNHSEAHAGQSVAGVDGAPEAVSAQSLPSSRPTNRLATASLPRTSTRSEHDDSDDDGDDSTSSSCITLSAERVFEADSDNGDMPTDGAEPGRKSSRVARKRASTTPPKTFKTPMKRQKLSDETAGNLTSSVVKEIPRHLIQPAKLHQVIAEVLGDSDNSSVMPWMGFFFSLASPPAIERLRDACISVRNSQRHSLLPEEAGVLQSMRALDRIDMHEHVSPILRRYHLVQLVKRRDQIYDEIFTSGAQLLPLVRKRGLRNQTATSATEGTKRAAALALERLVSEAYPDDRLQMTEDNAQDKTTQRQKRFKKLKNRLSDGQNWNLLQERFSIGILALVYTGPDAGFSNTV